MIETLKNNSIKLVMVFPLLFILMPRPPIDGIHFLTFPAIASLLGLICIIMIKGVNFDKNFIVVSSFLYFYAMAVGFSILFNTNYIGVGSISHIVKPILFLVVLLFGYIIGIKKNISSIKKGLLVSAYVILFAQLIIGLTQLYGINIFGSLYSMEKTRPLGQIVRIAGTMDNPNLFAWVVIQMSMIVFLFEKKISKKWIGVSIGIVLVFFSGSRSMLVIFPGALFLATLLINRKTLFFYFVKLPFYAVILWIGLKAGYWFIYNFGYKFPYMYQLLHIIDSGSLNSVNSFNARTIMWNDAWKEVYQRDSSLTWLFGLGPGSIGVLDNDYMYSFINYGLIFTTINILMYIVIFIYFSKIKDMRFSALGKQYIIFSLIIGYQADTISGWNYPLLILFYTGIGLALYRKQLLTQKDALAA